MMLQKLSIRTRLLFLSGILIAMIAGATYYLITKLDDNSRAVTRNAELAALIDIAQDVRNNFGQYRYWTTDLAVSLLRQSEVNAHAARERLFRRLDDLARRRPDLATVLQEQIGEFEKAAMQAVELYTDDKRVLGNTLLAQARQHSVVIDDRLSALVDDLNHEVVQGRDQVVADVTRTTRIAYFIVAVAIILGIATTLVVLRSILVPLRHVISAMDGITAGNLNTPIPPAAPDEIGAMAKTLQLFRGSIVERARLAEEGDRQRRMIETSLRTIPDGFVLYDSDDRLVLCNSRFRDLYPGISDLIVPGIAFADILRAVVDRKLIDLGGKTPDQWINERMRQHADPSRLSEYQYNSTWVRISERRTPDGSTVSVYTDITELKQRQTELERAMEQAKARTRELASSLEDLRTAQDRLVQTEKLASLGQLTAGIAHEIKNPLNFVNNFSAVSVELIDELREALDSAHLDDKLREEIGEIADMLQGNLGKVVQHGKRADSIVKNMLLHSRQDAGERRPVEINAIVEESLNLAYHGARAERQGFNITLERSFDPAAGEVDLFPQEITRVLLNLISNGFYAATKRKAQANGGDYEPTLSAATKSLGDSVEIRIRDNGTGIPSEVKEKMFNPFFTTKPAGEGTGLGLSLSYDIIVKQHGGSIEVDTQPGKFTEFRIVLPRAAAAIAKPGQRT
jgi:signal transduction histidine kinase/HAMP domain-containing protein